MEAQACLVGRKAGTLRTSQLYGLKPIWLSVSKHLALSPEGLGLRSTALEFYSLEGLLSNLQFMLPSVVLNVKGLTWEMPLTSHMTLM